MDVLDTVTGTIKNGKKKYKIKLITMGEYEEYAKIIREEKNPFKALEFIVKKTTFREIELKIFGKTIKIFKIFDFDMKVIPISGFEKFQNDILKVTFGESFLAKAKERGDVQRADILKEQ